MAGFEPDPTGWFYPILDTITLFESGRPGQTGPNGPAVMLEWVMPVSFRLIPPGGSGLDNPGPFNLGRRGELAYGDVCNRADDNARRSAQIADGE